MVDKSLIQNSTLVALVPMRHKSERIPGKNFRAFAGKPLYHHIINSLKMSPKVSSIVIDTDSPTIHSDVQLHFPETLLIERPEHLRDGTTPMNDVLQHDVNEIEADFFLQTHSTNPLLKPETITRASELFFFYFPYYDSLYSVTKMQARLWNDKGRPINHDPAVLLRTQDLRPVYIENSCIYIFSKDTLLKTKNRIGKNPLLFETDPIESWDIDEEHDFILAEKMYEEIIFKELKQ